MRVSFWLLPLKDDAAALRALIDMFAAEFNAPRFDPHVTLHSCETDEGTAKSAIEMAGKLVIPPERECQPLRTTGDVAKTLFVPLETCPELEALSSHFSAHAPAQYSFVPHLSLLYKPLPEHVLEDLARRFSSPLRNVRFDKVRAVETSGDLAVKGEVEAWRTIAEGPLAPLPPEELGFG